MRLDVSAGKLDVCALPELTRGGLEVKTTESPGEAAGWRGHWELMWYLEAPKVDVIMRCIRRKTKALSGTRRQSVAATPGSHKR